MQIGKVATGGLKSTCKKLAAAPRSIFRINPEIKSILSHRSSYGRCSRDVVRLRHFMVALLQRNEYVHAKCVCDWTFVALVSSLPLPCLPYYSNVICYVCVCALVKRQPKSELFVHGKRANAWLWLMEMFVVYRLTTWVKVLSKIRVNMINIHHDV